MLHPACPPANWSWQIMLPALTSLLTSQGYGQLSVGFMHLRPKGLLTILTLANHRFFIHFGEDHCRLSSDQPILEAPDSKRSISLTIISKTLLFGLPDEHQTRFESLWVDQLAYTTPWRKHVSGTVEELNQMTSWVSSISTVSVSLLITDLSSQVLCSSHVRNAFPLPGKAS